MSVSRDIVAYLEAQGVGDEDLDIFATPVEPGIGGVPVRSIWVFHDNVLPPQPYLASTRDVDWAHICTVRVREHQSKFQDGEALALEVMRALEQAEIAGYYSARIFEPFRLVGKDGQGNHQWEMAVMLNKKETL